MSEVKPFFDKPLSVEELTNAVDAQLDAAEAKAMAADEAQKVSLETQATEKWRHEAMHVAAIQRLITETVDRIRENENQETLTRNLGESAKEEHAAIVNELDRLNYQLDTARVIEQNMLEKLKIAGKTLEDASVEEANISEDKIEETKDNLFNIINEIADENQAQIVAREAIDKAA